jgi:class 3 adenylate cyclase
VLRRALVTVVFCDLVGSTALGERLDAELLRQVLARYFAACAKALERHGGQVEKYIGDAVMCVYGLPRAHEDDAVRGCRGAWELRDAVAGLSDALHSEVGVRLQVRVGVHTGEVVAGDPGRSEGLVTGDAVNTAARLEQAAPHGEILIGELTRRLAGAAIEAEPVGAVDAKGKAESVPAFRLTGVRALGEPGPLPSGVPLVGRERDLEQLEAALAEATAGSRCVLRVVSGEPGIGKSRLVAELIARLPPGARALTGRCPPYGEGVTWWPLREIAEELIEQGDDLVRGEAIPLLRLTGLEDGDAEPGAAIAALLAGLGRSGTAVLSLEDLHWAEPALLDLLQSLPGELDGVAALVLGIGRPEALDARAGLAQAAMRLEPLDAGSAHALLEARGVDSPERRDELARAAGGNPLFLEQLEPGAAGAVPPSLRALIAARLDALDEAERTALDAAAVVGREFWPGAVRELLGEQAAADLLMVLGRLEELEIVGAGRAHEPGPAPRGLTRMFGADERWSFRHSLVQETAYATLPKQRRADLHVAFADLLEARGGAPAALVGWHLERAARLSAEVLSEAAPALAERAAQWLARADRESLAASDPHGRSKLRSRSEELRARSRTWSTLSSPPPEKPLEN